MVCALCNTQGSAHRLSSPDAEVRGAEVWGVKVWDFTGRTTRRPAAYCRHRYRCRGAGACGVGCQLVVLQAVRASPVRLGGSVGRRWYGDGWRDRSGPGRSWTRPGQAVGTVARGLDSAHRGADRRHHDPARGRARRHSACGVRVGRAGWSLRAVDDTATEQRSRLNRAAHSSTSSPSRSWARVRASRRDTCI